MLSGKAISRGVKGHLVDTALNILMASTIIHIPLPTLTYSSVENDPNDDITTNVQETVT